MKVSPLFVFASLVLALVAVHTASASPTRRNDVQCNGHGQWDGTTCTCWSNYFGSACETSRREHCNDHGTWDDTQCVCDDVTWFYGEFCEIDAAATSEAQCHGHGQWDGSLCHCWGNYFGSTCENERREYCNGHGSWDGSQCVCDNVLWYFGDRCEINNAEFSETQCHGHGQWDGSQCVCWSNYFGSTCENNVREYCNDHGEWDGLACVCDDVNWYHGEFCEVKA